MGMYAGEVVKLAKSWQGRKESDGTHKEIIDIYNKIVPLPRGYKVKYTDSWCATMWSAIAIKLGYTSIMPIECSCGKLIEKAKSMGIWVEPDSYKPKLGVAVLYDWNDNGKGDCTGYPEHIGVVTSVSRETFTVTEGNYDNRVKERVLKYNAKYIRGFIVPKYDSEASEKDVSNSSKGVTKVQIELSVLRKGSKGAEVVTFQTLLQAKGFDLGKDGIDGDFGTMTERATKLYQFEKGLKVDGVAGKDTWTDILT